MHTHSLIIVNNRRMELLLLNLVKMLFGITYIIMLRSGAW